jgi:hypothetical protein
MAFGNRTTRSYNIDVPTILFFLLTAVIQNLDLQLTRPPIRAAAQQELGPPLIVGGLLVLLIIAIVLFWRISRKPRQESTPQAETAPEQVPPSEVSPAMVVSLEFTAEGDQPVLFVLDKPMLTIGRASDNDIVLVAPIRNVDSASKHHARVRRDQDDYIVRDNGSTNGLAVNGRQTLENVLQDGDRVQFGEVEAIFHRPAGGAP